jgi:hypothetical protein
MAVTLLGSSAVAQLLNGTGRVTIANQTAPEDDVTIVAFALVRHQSDGSTHQDAAFDLAITADQSVGVEAMPPLPASPAAVEVTLRLRIGSHGEVVDAYAVSQPASVPATGQFEFGVKPAGEALEDGEDPVPGFAEFAIYALPAE